MKELFQEMGSLEEIEFQFPFAVIINDVKLTIFEMKGSYLGVCLVKQRSPNDAGK